jgi:hypothetical protein
MELKNVQIIKIKPLQQVTDTYKKVEFIVKIESQYPQEVQFEIAQDKADKFIQYNKEGDFVDIDFNLRGRSYLKNGEPEDNRRWFNSLDAWKVFKAETNNQENEPSPQPQGVQEGAIVGKGTEEEDLLPF